MRHEPSERGALGWIGRAAAMAVGLALVIAAAAKAWTPIGTFHSIQGAAEALLGVKGSDGLNWVKVGVACLVAAEVGIGLGLLVWPGQRMVRWIALGLLAAFAVYGLTLIVLGVPVGCGCGVTIRLPGVDDRWLSVVRSVLLAAAVGPWMAAFEEGSPLAEAPSVSGGVRVDVGSAGRGDLGGTHG